MKFRQVKAATIAIYVLFTLLWFTLNSFASELENNTIDKIPRDSDESLLLSTSTLDYLNKIKTQILSLQEMLHAFDENTKINTAFLEPPKIPQELQQNFSNILPLLNEINQQISSLQPKSPPYQLLNEIKPNILSIIFNKFLTMQDILIFRQTCKNFEILLQANGKKMVMFCKNFCSKEIDNVLLTWTDLKYFLNQSYYTAFESMEMFNIKINQYAILTCTPDKNIISWLNTQTPYPEMLFYKTRKELLENEQDFDLIQYDRPKIYNNGRTAWAQITKERNVVTGGNKYNESEIAHDVPQLKNVKIIVSTSPAFAALLDDGSVFVWRAKHWEGKLPDANQILLQHVKMIYSTTGAFAFLSDNCSVFAWGNENYGGKIPHDIQSKLIKNVTMIYSTYAAFAALLQNGSVVAWGDKRSGGEIPDTIHPQLQHVQMISSTGNAFAALLDNGSVWTWGDEREGGIIPYDIVFKLIKNVKMIYSTHRAFAALLYDGSVVAWGHRHWGGKIPHDIQSKFEKNVKMIYSNRYAFAALLDDGSVFAWGDESWGGKIPDDIQSKLVKNVKMIYSTDAAFAALLDNGSVFAWSNKYWGNIIPDDIQAKLTKNVKMILPKNYGFTFLCKTGEMIDWGN